MEIRTTMPQRRARVETDTGCLASRDVCWTCRAPARAAGELHRGELHEGAARARQEARGADPRAAARRVRRQGQGHHLPRLALRVHGRSVLNTRRQVYVE